MAACFVWLFYRARNGGFCGVFVMWRKLPDRVTVVSNNQTSLTWLCLRSPHQPHRPRSYWDLGELEIKQVFVFKKAAIIPGGFRSPRNGIVIV